MKYNEYDQDVGDGQETQKLYLDHLAIIIIIIVVVVLIIITCGEHLINVINKVPVTGLIVNYIGTDIRVFEFL